MTGGPYTPDWYSSHQNLTRASAQAAVPAIMEYVAPHSVVDVGCGVGEWAMAFSQAGVANILGIDGGYVRQANLQIPPEKFFEADLTKPLVIQQRFDLAVCLEVAEHLPVEAGPVLVRQLVQLAPVVLFSAAIPQQGGQDHRNEQWPEYWQALFEQESYAAADCLRAQFWDRREVASHYAQNMVFYVNRQHVAEYPKLAGLMLPPGEKLRRLVHPDRFLATANLGCFSLGQVIRALPNFVAHSIGIRWQRLVKRQSR